MARASSAEICRNQSWRAMCASSCKRTMRRRSSSQCAALEGRTMTGREIPHVSGMASGLLHWRRRTEREILWDSESFKTVRIQSLSKSGFEYAETHARRESPAASLRKMNEKPRAHAWSVKTASWLKIGEPDRTLMMTEGIV